MRNPEFTRQRLTDVAVRAMAQYGGAGVRVDRIAAESGINKRMIYHYFGGKEGLCANVLALQISALSDILIEPQLAMLRTQLASLLPSGNAPIGKGYRHAKCRDCLGQRTGMLPLSCCAHCWTLKTMICCQMETLPAGWL